MMPNHVHLILTPTQAEGLATAMKISQAAYTRRINAREDWTGTLWQGRFTSFPMDEAHLLMAARYIELNPVRAGLVDDPAKYPWSSTRERLGYGGDRMISPQPLSDLVPDWAKFLRQPLERGQLNDLRHCARTGRLAGSDAFIAQAEAKTGRRLALQRAARPANT